MIRTLRNISVAALIAALPLILSHDGNARASSPHPGFAFDTMATIPAAAPGLPGRYLINDFEADGWSDSGWAIYGADFTTTPAPPPVAPAVGEGLWLQKVGGLPTLVAATGDTDPEGVTYASGYIGPADVNNAGDVVMAWRLLPLPPTGVDGTFSTGLYRYNRASGQVTTVAKTGWAAPGGIGTFEGIRFTTDLANNGEIAFHGIYETASGTYSPAPLAPRKFGVGLFRADRHNQVTAVVLPGDAAPLGGTFDNLRNGWISENGDIAFGGHTSLDPACTSLSCNESVYVRRAQSGVIESVAHVGGVAPIAPNGDWIYTSFAFGPRINASGSIVFVAGVKNSVTLAAGRALFMFTDDGVGAIAYPDQALVADGSPFTIVQVASQVQNYFVNDAGEVSFNAVIAGDANGDSRHDTGVFVWNDGSYHLISRTGDVVPGAGTVSYNGAPITPMALLTVARTITGPGQPNVNGRALINNRGQVLFAATMSDGTARLLVATP